MFRFLVWASVLGFSFCFGFWRCFWFLVVLFVSVFGLCFGFGCFFLFRFLVWVWVFVFSSVFCRWFSLWVFCCWFFVGGFVVVGCCLWFLLVVFFGGLSSFSSSFLFLSLSILSPVDDKGYDIKEEGWFQGLSGALGDSINDPRVVPVAAKGTI